MAPAGISRRIATIMCYATFTMIVGLPAESQSVSLGSSIIIGLILSPIFRYNDFINLLKKNQQETSVCNSLCISHTLKIIYTIDSLRHAARKSIGHVTDRKINS